MKNKSTLFLVQAAAIGAIYVVLTLVFAPLGFGEVQIRFAEALTVLPYFTPAAIPGLFVGCIIANFLGGALPVDILFGSIATLLGAIFTYRLRGSKWLAPLPLNRSKHRNRSLCPLLRIWSQPSDSIYDADGRCRRSSLLRNHRNGASDCIIPLRKRHFRR